MFVCGPQCVGDNVSVGWWLVSPANVSSAAGTEAGSLPACPEETAGGPDEDHGQCGHILHAADALHLHLQVSTPNKTHMKHSHTQIPQNAYFNILMTGLFFLSSVYWECICLAVNSVIRQKAEKPSLTARILTPCSGPSSLFSRLVST